MPMDYNHQFYFYQKQGMSYLIAGFLLLGYTFDLLTFRTILAALSIYFIMYGLLLLNTGRYFNQID